MSKFGSIFWNVPLIYYPLPDLTIFLPQTPNPEKVRHGAHLRLGLHPEKALDPHPDHLHHGLYPEKALDLHPRGHPLGRQPEKVILQPLHNQHLEVRPPQSMKIYSKCTVF